MSTQPYLDALDIPTPSQVDHRPYIHSITIAIEWAHKHKNAPPRVTDPEADFVIYISFLKSDTEWWTARFKDSQKKAARFWRDPNTYWKAIAMGVCTPESIGACKKMLPSLDPENYLIKTSDAPALQQIAPELTAIPTIGDTLKKVVSRIPRPRTKTVTEFILRHSPSRSYEQVYSTTLGCCWNKRSAKGKKVYPYGQPYIAKLTGLSLRTVVYAWSWLRKRGIFNKAWNENPKEHRCAGWYVCTSMKQVSYFRDPENRHRKSKRQN